MKIKVDIKANNSVAASDNISLYLSELKNEQEVRIELPTAGLPTNNDPTKQINYYVSVEHDGVMGAAKLATTNDDGTISVKSDKFSIYTVFYKIEDIQKQADRYYAPLTGID